MTRAELRREKKDEQKKTKTFVLTQEQIDVIKDQAVVDATQKAFILMLAVPLEVLIREDYWMKSAKKKAPKFIKDVLEIYKAYEQGLISLAEMEEDLWTFGGIKCEKGR